MASGVQYASIATVVILSVLFFIIMYIKAKKNHFNEKRFSFFVLWYCFILVSTIIASLLEASLLDSLLERLGLPSSSPGTFDKILVIGLACFFILVTSHWAQNWNGLTTKDGLRAKTNKPGTIYVIDGLRETYRVITLKAPWEMPRSLPDENHNKGLTLTAPLPEQSFQEQVRDLLLGKWSEYIIDDSSWTGEAQCWIGHDTALDETLIVFCGVDEGDINISSAKKQIGHSSTKGPVHVIVVLETIHQKNAEMIKDLRSCSSNIEIYSFDELIFKTLPLARYKREIRKQYQENKILGASFSLSDVIVDAKILETQVEQSGKIKEKGSPIDFLPYVEEWLTGKTSRHLALLGDYGQGKSTAALDLTYRLLHDEEFAGRCGNRIPILIKLTGLSPKASNPAALLGAWSTGLGPEGNALLALHRAGRTILIFDAFDEMANVADRADRFEHFGMLWQFASRNAKIIFTGRPNFFLDDEELKRALEIAEGSTVGPYCSALRLSPFSDEQIKESLRWLPPDKVATFMEATRRLPRLEEIVRRPSLLFQVAHLWNSGRLELDESNIQSAGVIRSFVTYSLERQVAKQRAENQDNPENKFIPLRQSELEYFTFGCAVAALSDGRNNSIPIQTFETTIRSLWDRLPEDMFSVSLQDTGSLAMPLRERLEDKSDPVEACMQAVRTHGVMEIDPTKSGFYKFSHKSFAEVLAAEVLVSRGLKLRNAAAEVWKAMKPNPLMSQRTIFSMSSDLASTLSNEKVTSGPNVISSYLSDISPWISNYLFWMLKTSIDVSLFFQTKKREGIERQIDLIAKAIERNLPKIIKPLLAVAILGLSAFMYASSFRFSSMNFSIFYELLPIFGILFMFVGFSAFIARYLTQKLGRGTSLARLFLFSYMIAYTKSTSGWRSDAAVKTHRAVGLVVAGLVWNYRGAVEISDARLAALGSSTSN